MLFLLYAQPPPVGLFCYTISMRKIVMFNFVTADGYFAGTDGNIDWHPVDEEFNSFAVDFIRECDMALFGRTTYDLFADFWPAAASDTSLDPEDLQIARALSEMRKIVITHENFEPNWANTQVWQDVDVGKIGELKQQNGKNIVIYGSGTIVKQLTDLDLIDEYHIIVAPVVLGGGKSLFEGNASKKLELIESKTFESGNVLLRYTPFAISPTL